MLKNIRKKILDFMMKITMKKSFVLLVFILFLSLIIRVCSNYSYAYFFKTNVIDDFSIVVGDLTYQFYCDSCLDGKIVLDGNASTILNIKLTSEASIDSKYKVYYKLVTENVLTNDIEAGYLGVKGQTLDERMNAYETKEFYIILKNKSDKKVTIEIGYRNGLDYNEVLLENKENHINKIITEGNDIYITEVNYINNTNANLDESKIFYAYQNSLNSIISLSKTDNSSQITYKITIHNSSDTDYYFYNVNYEKGDTTYSNENIAFKLDGLSYNTKIPKGSSHTFNITFYYVDNSSINANNDLRSILNFIFVEATSYELQSIHGDYNLTTICNAGIECKNMTVENFLISIDEIIIPEPAYGTMTFEKTYDPSTGAFKITRSRLTGKNFITYSGIVHMLNNPIWIANKEGSYNISIDCTSIANYKNMSADDFYYEISWLEAPEELHSVDSDLNGVSGTINFSKTYDASTGTLTIQRSSIKGTGVVTFAVDVYIAE